MNVRFIKKINYYYQNRQVHIKRGKRPYGQYKIMSYKHRNIRYKKRENTKGQPKSCPINTEILCKKKKKRQNDKQE